MMIPLGILTGDDTFRNKEDLEVLGAHYEIKDFSDWKSYDKETLLEKCRSVEVLLMGKSSPKLPPELNGDRGRLRYLCHIRGTIRPYVDKELLAAGLLVTNWGDSQGGVAEGAMALLLCMLKQIPALDAFTQGEEDKRVFQDFRPTLKELDVGVYGYGPIGRHMVRMLEAFGSKVAIFDPYAKDVNPSIRVCGSLEDLFATCKAVSIHCGLNDQTRLSVTRECLALLPQGGIVINTARGEVVDEDALADDVRSGRLLAGLDVIRNERDWGGSPLAGLPGVVLTRHTVSSGKGFPPDHRPMAKIPVFAMRNLEFYRQGLPLVNVIRTEDYDLKT